MTQRKLIDVPKILAVLDAEKHLVHGSLVAPIGAFNKANDDYARRCDNDTLPQPGPLAVANCEHVGRCAMGALIYATGRFTFYRLSILDGDAAEWDFDVVKALYNAYGLQRYHARSIIDANDSGGEGEDEPSIAERRARVKERVRQLAEQQANDPASDLEECAQAEQAYSPDSEPLDIDERLAQLGLQGEPL